MYGMDMHSIRYLEIIQEMQNSLEQKPLMARHVMCLYLQTVRIRNSKFGLMNP